MINIYYYYMMQHDPKHLHPNGTCFPWQMAATCNRYKFVTVSLPKRPRNGRFTSETATLTQKRFKKIRWGF
jgi:hypothetical protein